MKRFRGLAVLIALVTLVALASAGSWVRTAAVPQPQPNAISAPAPAPAPSRQAADQAACADPFGGGLEQQGCHDCPKSLLPDCTRISCIPCCFHCPGDPFNRCL
jgi:hypothetical protein